MPRVSDSQSHLPTSQLWYLDPLNTHGSGAFFFFCITTGNKGGVTFLSILSSGYVPLSPHDVHFHPYKNIFCRAVFSWCNFRDKQMAIGLWRCYWIVTAGNKVPAEKSSLTAILQTELPALTAKQKKWVHIFLLVKWSHLTQSPWNTVHLEWYLTAFAVTNQRRNVICCNFL